MIYFLWKFSMYTNGLKLLEYPVKQVFGVDKWFKVMANPRGRPRVWGSPLVSAAAKAYYAPWLPLKRPHHEDYDRRDDNYDYDRRGADYDYDRRDTDYDYDRRVTDYDCDKRVGDYDYDKRGGGMPPQSSAGGWLNQQQTHLTNKPNILPPERVDYERKAYNMDVPVNVNCGELQPSYCGTLVQMKGRVQQQHLNKFIMLRDFHGTTQLVVSEERFDLSKRISNIPVNSHMEIIGIVQRRPSNTINATMATGEIEVKIEDILTVASAPVQKRKLLEMNGEEAPVQTGKKARSSILVTSAELERCVTPAIKRKFLQRTHTCGELNASHVNLDVTLCGWVQSVRNERFIILRDGYGAAQLVINPNDFAVTRSMQCVELKSVIVVKGNVSLRPSHQANPRMATGTIEIKVNSVQVVDPNEPEPDNAQVDGEAQEMDVQEVSNGTGPPSGDVNSYVCRTHTCGQLRGGDVGQNVTLCGWLDSQRGIRFGTVRDGHGKTQFLMPTELEATLGKQMSVTPLESVIMVKGIVSARPPEKITEIMDTGEIEVLVKEYTVLNPAIKKLPFHIKEHNKPKEPLRMKYRYLDLRFSDMQHRLRLRSKVLMRMREFLINQRGFVEIETPTLFRRTPGGAQEYVVPTRLEGKFYSLVQSPQQLKQLLMVGAMDRYFQVARCYRDEGARPDRQPEFTQMDIELSFTDREGILTLIEDLLRASWPDELEPLQTPFPIITYHDAMHLYGSDKPDLSIDRKLVDIVELITEEKKLSLPENLRNIENFTVKVLIFNQNYQLLKLKDKFEECEKQLKEKETDKVKLIQVKCSSSKWTQELTEALQFVEIDKLKEILQLSPPFTIVVGIGQESIVLPLMGKLRKEVLSTPTTNFHFAWIVDFPLFLEGDDGHLEAAHHPFTKPLDSDFSLISSDPLKVRGLHFDLVLNGFEVGGGSVRIHDATVQAKVLKDILKIPTDTLQHLLEALRSGAPPHGGIALGMDRLMSIIVGAESIRDVIAFPKGVDGKDPLCGAPSEISEEERKIYHLSTKK